MTLSTHRMVCQGSSSSTIRRDASQFAHLKLKYGFFRILSNGFYGCPRHEVEQRQDQVGALAQYVVGLTSIRAEADIRVASLTPHRLDHFLTEQRGGSG